MGYGLSLIKGMGIGAGLMYLLDPDLGRRRRALINDQFVHSCNTLEDFLGKASRDLSNRASGLIAELGSLLSDETPSDRVLVDRVRSKLGRVVSHPRAIEVAARDGYVTLRGPILEAEVDHLLTAVASVPGVTGVEDRLEPHPEAGTIPALQGGRRRPGERSELFQETWSPATKLLLGIAGGMLALQLARRGGLPGLAIGALGVGLAARGIADQGAQGGRAPRAGRRESRRVGSTATEAVARPGPTVRATGL